MAVDRHITRISLDAVMLVLLVLMYEAQVIAIRFHEVGGLAVCGLFVIHHVINWRWIVGVTKRFFRASLPVKTRIGYIVNVLLLVAVAVIALTGIMISQTIFVEIFGTTPLWRFGHLFSSALALALTGVHTGLHWSYIQGMLSRVVSVQGSAARPFGMVCLVLALGFGIYSVLTTDLAVWLMAPLVVRGILSQELTMRLLGGADLPGSPLEVIATFGSIVVLFAAVTIGVERALKKQGRAAK